MARERVAGHPLRACDSLRRSPGFTLTALATLILGIGVNTTLFALVNALLFQPWRRPIRIAWCSATTA